jgi:hypothetical protein
VIENGMTSENCRRPLDPKSTVTTKTPPSKQIVSVVSIRYKEPEIVETMLRRPRRTIRTFNAIHTEDPCSSQTLKLAEASVFISPFQESFK